MLFLPDAYFTYDKHYTLLNDKNFDKINLSISTIERDKYVVDLMNSDPIIVKMKKNDENYYIIDKIKSETFGPFNKQEFDRKSKDLKITLSFD